MVYNPKAQNRREMVSVLTDKADVWVLDPDSNTIPSQASIVWENDIPGSHVLFDQFRIWFEVRISFRSA